MLKKITGLMLAGAIVMSVPVMASVSANEQGSTKYQSVMTGSNTSVERIYVAAEKFRITTKGKTVDQLNTEVKRAEKQAQKASTLLKAKKFGIVTKGKTIEQISVEIKRTEKAQKAKATKAEAHKAAVVKKAKSIGIVTKGKTAEQILVEGQRAEKAAKSPDWK
ncbi:hypothetical protein [Paenibacillus herberti]|uniref:DUF5667 domain-containing protein n=1 Tax=Paenibacillus herberti TaxID=1619309 RepID=A0A229P2D1_9BACL|nr:hypothetical protein [Paenibacillus herberti]OXM16268.1 hypothetical protein CGZ75_06140 [Paenibacillus herberti]